MEMFAAWAGGTLATLASPQILVAGLIVARKSPREGVFWVQSLLAIFICTVIHYAFGGQPNVAEGILYVSSAFGLATAIFLGIRKLRKKWQGAAVEAEV